MPALRPNEPVDTSSIKTLYEYKDWKPGGGTDDVQAITVATYDSAYIRAASFGNKFSLIVFDEVHHLAAPGYKSIAEQMVAPYRLGLTATIKRR